MQSTEANKLPQVRLPPGINDSNQKVSSQLILVTYQEKKPRNAVVRKLAVNSNRPFIPDMYSSRKPSDGRTASVAGERRCDIDATVSLRLRENVIANRSPAAKERGIINEGLEGMGYTIVGRRRL